MFNLSNATFGSKYIKSQNMPDLEFKRSQETRRILLKGQNMPDVMSLVVSKLGTYCFKSPKTCALSKLKSGNE